MALSDSPKTKYLPSSRRRPVNAGTNKPWSDSQKIEAVQTYLALGQITLTAAVLKIPEVTLRYWKSKEWWKEIELELRHQDDLILSSRLQKIINKSFEQVEDRLANGDYVYDQKTGDLKRKPVSLRDAHKVAIDLVDKREFLINKIPVAISADAIDDKLEKLAKKFAEIAGVIKPPVVVTDVIIGDEIINEDEEQSERVVTEAEQLVVSADDWVLGEDENAIHEEGEREIREGLQEGERVIQLETGADQTTL